LTADAGLWSVTGMAKLFEGARDGWRTK